MQEKLKYNYFDTVKHVCECRGGDGWPPSCNETTRNKDRGDGIDPVLLFVHNRSFNQNGEKSLAIGLLIIY